MDIVYLSFLFVVGTFFGSFINVVALRYNTGLSSFSGRSMCPNCGRKLSWFELIPIFSFIFLSAKCRTCGSKISWRYFWVEVIAGIAFLFISLRQYYLYQNIFFYFNNGLVYSFLLFLYYSFIFGLLFVIALYDSRHKIVPDVLVYVFIGLSLIKLYLFIFFKDFNLVMFDYFDLLAPLTTFLPFFLLWYLSGGKYLGFGDVKLSVGIGALLGFVSGFSAIILAFWIGAVWSILMFVYTKIKQNTTLSFKSEIAFAPFLILATLVVYLTRFDTIGIGNFLQIFK